MIETYKILHNVYDSGCSDIFRYRTDIVGVPQEVTPITYSRSSADYLNENIASGIEL